jgi:hypothetical protein
MGNLDVVRLLSEQHMAVNRVRDVGGIFLRTIGMTVCLVFHGCWITVLCV